MGVALPYTVKTTTSRHSPPRRLLHLCFAILGLLYAARELRFVWQHVAPVFRQLRNRS